MSARATMTHRALVERDIASPGTDDYEEIPIWQTLHESLPCRYWVRTRRELNPSQTVNISAVVSDARVMCPVVDITEGDRISQIVDRQGVVVVDGPLDIQGIERRLYGDPHLELLVREVD